MKLQIIIGLIAFPMAAAAQDVEALRERVTNLETRYESARDLWRQEQEFSELNLVKSAVVIFGNLTIEIRGDEIQRWIPSIEEAATRIENRFGKGLFNEPFSVRLQSIYESVLLNAPEYNFDIGVTANPDWPQGRVTESVEDALLSLLQQTMDPSWKEWIGGSIPLAERDARLGETFR
ncbi:MAG: hypothetical protein OEZ54_12790, partial [Gemmatimonadota bacterium]|nr:hypothetical protein [Gemmatimonadota bacterium]